MPGACLHLLLARSVLRDWSARAAPPPFRTDDERNARAFLHGALAPDMGYFPGARTPLSDLVHRSRGGDLVRTLVELASTEVQRAHAWGWVTHVLADVAIHPLINRAAGGFAPGRRGRPLSVSEGPLLHLRIELGLDAYVAARANPARAPQLTPVLEAPDARFVARAYSRVYGPGVTGPEVLRAHRAVARTAPLLLALTRAVGTGGRAVRGRPAGGGLPALRRPSPSPAKPLPASGFVASVVPTPWLLREVARQVRSFGLLSFRHYDSRLRELENRDLDTGRLAGGAGDAAPAGRVPSGIAA